MYNFVGILCDHLFSTFLTYFNFIIIRKNYLYTLKRMSVRNCVPSHDK